ncbi:MAG TPA: STAS domain-containing protein [Ilumatobacter sp.]|nr:STAS domain-containing protein [Ilumatobacter sp.]
MNESAVVVDLRQHVANGLEVTLSVDGPHLVVALHGEIDAANADLLPAVVAGAVNGDDSVRVDITNVTFLDSSLLRALLICETRLLIDGVELKVRNPSPQARRIFELTNLASLLE